MVFAAVILLVAVGVLLSVRFFSGNEDGWLCQNGEWIKHGDPSGPVPSTGCAEETKEQPADNTAIANPASVNCEEKGGKVEIRKDESGGEYGMCVFENGKECDEWAFFRGECTSVTTTPVSVERRGTETTLLKPSADEPVASPLSVEGSVPGSWYFEAVAGVEILDANGKVLGKAPAQAQSEWMTANPVNFKSTVEFTAPTTTTGTLILKNDNPSGLPANSRSESYPITFGVKVNVYFGNTEKNPEALDCALVFAVERVVPKTPDLARAALNELFKGVNENEKSEKYFTSINDGVVIQKLTIENGVAKVDLNPRLEEAVGGSCRVAAISSQIKSTLKQFPSVKSVIISIDGRTEDILQP